ncbi:saccharopine dehydrogenase NADP-binding domain-containing protein [Agromyces larvae]|uniref:Saccharopine dehydrogenase NADP-binding domain-containing protein n=1 Tax=Agromyces larvae TaxID=2929802 RepID=A0ABY4C0I0_9MICO|nr:saccharopine dehydrogenase NADP-binding domain-containing protein [Agromyces larvae]UOE44982.1 saccharopine dehydrogenase NADP-binding domain-containing protein [Agromyces larvae]
MSADAAASEPIGTTGAPAKVLVYGAYGHTGRFVVTELVERGHVPVLSGRNETALAAMAGELGLEARQADVSDATALDAALHGVAALVNCAGPFAHTTEPLLDAALRAQVAYVDVAAEIEANEDTFSRLRGRADLEGAIVVPAMAFFGGLGDLLATAAAGDWTDADEVRVAYGLSSWHPTAGTRAAGAVSRERRDGRHVTFEDGGLRYGEDRSELTTWSFPEPTGARDVRSKFSMADIVTIPKHLAVREVTCFMTVEAVSELSSPATPEPVAVDESGRSEQTFVVDVVVRRGTEERRAFASGQDIYAITGPLAAEAVDRILTGRTRTTGVAPAGAMFDPADFLDALHDELAWAIEESTPGES